MNNPDNSVACEDCAAPYGRDGWCDVIIPDEIWNSLGASLLCFRCMTKRLIDAGYGVENPVPVIVASGPYRDANEEWRLIGWDHGYKVGSQEVRQSRLVVAWCSEHALQRVASNTGVLAKVGFDERLANSQSDIYKVPLVRGDITQ